MCRPWGTAEGVMSDRGVYSGELSPGGREMMTSGGERHRTPDTPGHESEINN